MPPNTTFNARLLLAEDNPVNSDIATRILEGLGCRVARAENGAAAARLLAHEQFDLVLMDCEMPELDGFEATRLARAGETPLHHGQAGKRVPIVALTSHVLDDVRQRCLAAGMDDLLAKPFNKQQLREMLHRWIGELESPSLSSPTDHAAAPAERGKAAERTTDEVPVIDRTTLNTMLDSMGPAGRPFLERLCQRFGELAPAQISLMRTKYGAGKPDELWRIAHNLKSGARALGARRLAHRCAEIERRAREEGLGAIEALLGLAERDLALALESLHGLLCELDARAVKA